MTTSVSDLLKQIPATAILSAAPFGLFLVSPDRLILYWNEEAERITGFKADEVVGKVCSEVAGFPCPDRCRLFGTGAAQAETPMEGTCTIPRRDKPPVTVTKHATLLRDGNGRVIGGIEAFSDNTRQRHLEKLLRRQTVEIEYEVRRRTADLRQDQQRLASLLDAMSDLAYICSSDYRITFMNRAMERLFGPGQDALCYEHFHGRQTPCARCPLSQILAGETVINEKSFEIDQRTYEVIHTPLQECDGMPLKLAVHRDITERKESETRLREANRELDAFVYTISHDLRNPLTPIIGYSELLQEEYRDVLDAAGIDMLREIERQGQRMLALLEDLLSLAKVGHVSPPPKPVPVAAQVAETLQEFAQSLAHHQLTVQVGELPHLLIPPTLLSEVFSNLVGNAIRYAGRPGASIEIGSEGAGEQVRIFVRDHGPGIPAEDRARLFDVFYRGSTAGSAKGTGIGLATVRKIARLFDGRVWVEDTPGGGSTFWLEFPRPAISGH